MKIAWKPQPKQNKALESVADEILYGGARGGGKTDAGQAFMLYDSDHPKYRGLVIRQNYTDLSDWIDRAKDFYAPTGAVFVGDTFRFPNGGLIKTGHLNDKDAFTKYQGHEYQRMLIEELSQIAKEKLYLQLIASCRSSVPEIKPQVFSTTNPDDPGMEWIKIRWDIPDYPEFDKVYSTKKEVEINGKKEHRILNFIPARLEDNPILMKSDPAYLIQLELLKDVDVSLYEAWRNGSWTGSIVEGAYYAQQLKKADEENRITSVPYDEMLEVHTWCDLGISDSFSVGYFQMYGMQVRVIDYDEFEGESLGHVIGEMKKKPYRYGTHHAPHDIMVRELGTGKSRWEIAKSNGVNYSVGKQLPVSDGINALRMRFSTLWFDKDKCKLLLRRLRGYHKEFDEKRGVYKDKPVHDESSHGADMMRYWAIDEIDTRSTVKTYTPDYSNSSYLPRHRK